MKSKKRWHVGLTLLITAISLIALTSVSALAIYSSANIDFDADEALFTSSKSENVTKFYYDGSGNFGLVPEAYIPVELECVSGSEQRREWCSYNDVAESLKNAFIAAEDRSFFEHRGINFKRTLGAVLGYLFKSESYGGSTITQQVIKNISGDNDRTVRRKVNEIIRAFHLEYRHSKEEIFEMYMNVIPLGEGVSGVGLASEVYFGKEPSELVTEESALLCALANAPTKYNPYRDYNAALEKRNVIISCMRECGFIDDEEYARAKESPITLAERMGDDNVAVPWYIETICDEVVGDIVTRLGYSEKAARMYLMNGGLSVYTTIDPVAQGIIDSYFRDEDNFPEEIKNGLNYAFVLCDSRSGDLRGIVGGVGKKQGSRIINYALVPHTPASTLKPLALYAPLINEGKITWSTVFDDVPVSFTENGGEYIEYPKNSPSVYDGLTPIATALAKSKNTIAVRLYELLGAKRIADSLSENYGFNIISKGESGRSDLATSPLALGQLTYGIPLRRLTEAYSAFPADGVMHGSRSYVLCKDGNGRVIIEKKSEGERIYSKECARIMNQLLMGVVNDGTAKRITLKETVDVAGKTGTSGGNRDRLFVGYTPYLTAGIWMGYGDRSCEVGAYSQNQIKVWDDVMKRIHESAINIGDDAECFSVSGLVRCAYCIDSGKLFSPKCIKDPRGDRIAYGYFIKGSEPHEECNRHVLCDYDIFLRGVAVNPTFFGFIKEIALLDIPERSFPKEITITDAEYVYRKITDGVLPGDSYDAPYFIYSVPEGEYVGRSKSKKQFNSSNIYS